MPNNKSIHHSQIIINSLFDPEIHKSVLLRESDLLKYKSVEKYQFEYFLRMLFVECLEDLLIIADEDTFR